MRSALQRYTTLSVPADVVARLNAGVLALDATVALGSRPAPNTVQPAMPHRAASRAAPVGGTARAATLGTFTTATPAQSHGHLRPGRWSPVSLRRGSRPSRGSAALALPTRGFSAGRAGGPHATGRTCLRRRRCRGVECRPGGRATEYDVFADGVSSMSIVRRGSSARVASCLPRSMATMRTAPGFLWGCVARGAARRRRAGCERG